ncbi:hypothetical protein [Glaciibacter psychrotolerans]|uniref:Potassium transporter Trk n=1 Tax=Glaciibacter psychrotolerans TaxID=670054 RepID=A0A7Z0J7X0_9MICO|nr:hypothetical protein [Leifsonia psychrotolerans]NYJ21319.1 hypothetical protein [Leifsonia psychrotolerans]
MSSAEQPAPTDRPDQPVNSAQSADETVISHTTVVVHRSPRYVNFMILGAILGAVLALILTVAFPDNPDFGKAQVFGFLLLAGVAFGVAIGSLVALVIDRLIRSRTVGVDRLAAKESPADSATDVVTGTHSSNENSE